MRRTVPRLRPDCRPARRPSAHRSRPETPGRLCSRTAGWRPGWRRRGAPAPAPGPGWPPTAPPAPASGRRTRRPAAADRRGQDSSPARAGLDAVCLRASSNPPPPELAALAGAPRRPAQNSPGELCGIRDRSYTISTWDLTVVAWTSLWIIITQRFKRVPSTVHHHGENRRGVRSDAGLSLGDVTN